MVGMCRSGARGTGRGCPAGNRVADRCGSKTWTWHVQCTQEVRCSCVRCIAGRAPSPTSGGLVRFVPAGRGPGVPPRRFILEEVSGLHPLVAGFSADVYDRGRPAYGTEVTDLLAAQLGLEAG